MRRLKPEHRTESAARQRLPIEVFQRTLEQRGKQSASNSLQCEPDWHYSPIARRSIRPFLTGGHQRYTPVTGRVNVNSASAVPSSEPTMRFSCASKALSDLPKATNTSPARVASAQGIERRSTKASGEKLSCVVLFTCAEGGAFSSSLLSRLRRPIVSSCFLPG